MIDLKKYTQPEQVIAPIIDRWGRVNGRKIQLDVDDGWYEILLDSEVRIIKRASQLQIHKALAPMRSFRFYPLGDDGFPVNFDQFFERGVASSIKVYFTQEQPFTTIIAKLWEDKRLYYYETDHRHQRTILSTVARAYQQGHSLSDLQGITPEIRFYCLFHQFGKLGDLGMEFAKISRRDENRLGEISRTPLERLLERAAAQAGISVEGTSPVGAGICTVIWSINGQRVHTRVTEEGRVVSAGFCLSGDDRLHTIDTLMYTADRFINEIGSLHITSI